jgi:hypothetical protein
MQKRKQIYDLKLQKKPSRFVIVKIFYYMAVLLITEFLSNY